MTNSELNRDIKRLWKRFDKSYGVDTENAEHEHQRAEWLRLWRADPRCENMKVEQLKAMISINLTRRYKAIHTVGMFFVVNL